MRETTKWVLPDSEIPDTWLNIAMLVRDEYPLPVEGPDKLPMTVAKLARLYSEECARIDMLDGRYGKDLNISVPGEVMDEYRKYRCTPLVRARGLERALGYEGRIFYKSEAGNPSGSHKPNTAFPQVFYAMKQGLKGVVTDTGAGQWGTALAMAARTYGLSCTVFMTRSSYVDKPYRRYMMELAGATVHPSPSNLTPRGRKLLAEDPEHSGSLGIGMGEAMELGQNDPSVRLCLGCMSYHAALHQTVIGQEMIKQLLLAGCEPDVLIGCVGGGTNFFGFVAPYLERKLSGKSGPDLIAVESANCPALTKGEYRYDYADAFQFTPQFKMFTLGHEFVPPKVHAGGLRYHGKSAVLSLMVKKGLARGTAISQEDAFNAGRTFLDTEGVLAAPESAHAIAAVINEVQKAKASGAKKNIVFCLSGTGYLDLVGYAKVFGLQK
jgi:tryptophan synthase beta chain